MPLPRFQKLDADKREQILAAATAEFGEHPFETASYNRIIERAGISKGAMYYYFDGKEDLFRTALETAEARWTKAVQLDVTGPETLPYEPEAFWRACEAFYGRALRLWRAEPKTAQLFTQVGRAYHSGRTHPAIDEHYQRMFDRIELLVRAGQAIGAVRTDLPGDLLVTMVFGMLDTADRWLVANWKTLESGDMSDTATMLVGMLRRLGEP